MIAYKWKNRTIYVEAESDVSHIEGMHTIHYGRMGSDWSKVHFVCEVHWDLYMKLRKSVPRLCIIFDKVVDRKVALEKLGVLV